MKTFIVVPTIREECIKKFLKEWEFLGKDMFIVVEDNPKKSFDIKNVKHYCWEDIDKDLGKNAWIISRRSSAIKSYGFWKAHNLSADYVITLDDDCYPFDKLFVEAHIQKLELPIIENKWLSTISGLTPRGIPYDNITKEYETVINHGLWLGNVDLDAITQIANVRFKKKALLEQKVIPQGKYFPMSGMNLAFKRKVIPLMYFGLQGKDWDYDRYDDIWAGIVAKKICDHLKLSVKSGQPYIHHNKASNKWINLKKEQKGYVLNEKFWKYVDDIDLRGTDIKSCFIEIASQLPDDSYLNKLGEAMKIWMGLFNE